MTFPNRERASMERPDSFAYPPPYQPPPRPYPPPPRAVAANSAVAPSAPPYPYPTPPQPVAAYSAVAPLVPYSSPSPHPYPPPPQPVAANSAVALSVPYSSAPPPYAYPSSQPLPVAIYHTVAPTPYPSRPSYPSNTAAGPIVDPRFCHPHPVSLVITRQDKKKRRGNFVVKDPSGNVMFKVKEPSLSFHEKRYLADASGSPIITLYERIMTMHDRWQAFRGRSSKDSDLLFTVRRSSLMESKSEFDVFLARNKKEKVSDFKGSWSEDSCVVHAGETNDIVFQSKSMENGDLSLTVYPSVDCAFAAALIVILDGINRESSDSIDDFIDAAVEAISGV